MRSTLRPRFWLEAVLSVGSGLLGMVTLLWRDWIETLFRLDPDHHGGALEWLIVFGLVTIAVAAGLRARAEWSHAQAESSRVGAGA